MQRYQAYPDDQGSMFPGPRFVQPRAQGGGKPVVTLCVMVAVAVMVVAVVFAVLRSTTTAHLDSAGCRRDGDCGDAQTCAIDPSSGRGTCKASGCRSKEDKARCGGYCKYASETDSSSLFCACESDPTTFGDASAATPGSPFCKECKPSPAEAYKAAGGDPKDFGVGTNFVFCRSAPVARAAEWASGTGGPRPSAMPVYNSADPSAAEPFCVSSLTDPNFTVNQCVPGKQYCRAGQCVDIVSKAPAGFIPGHTWTPSFITKQNVLPYSLGAVGVVLLLIVIAIASTQRKRVY
jgi:hypothetical protein